MTRRTFALASATAALALPGAALPRLTGRGPAVDARTDYVPTLAEKLHDEADQHAELGTPFNRVVERQLRKLADLAACEGHATAESFLAAHRLV
jgi:hypothetical protein